MNRQTSTSNFSSSLQNTGSTTIYKFSRPPHPPPLNLSMDIRPIYYLLPLLPMDLMQGHFCLPPPPPLRCLWIGHRLTSSNLQSLVVMNGSRARWCRYLQPSRRTSRSLRRSSVPVSDLAGSKIGIEATAYIKYLIEHPPAHEPLRAALAGAPMSLKEHMREELDLWEKANLIPFFVFDGQSTVGKDYLHMSRAKSSLVEMQKAWRLYGENRAETAVKAFSAAGMTCSSMLWS